jgi:hypothetical protein
LLENDVQRLRRVAVSRSVNHLQNFLAHEGILKHRKQVFWTVQVNTASAAARAARLTVAFGGGQM